jgi:hypothetical protein
MSKSMENIALSFQLRKRSNEYDAISLMAGPEVRSVLRNMIPILLIEVKVELPAAQYFSRSEKDLGNTKSINRNDINHARILAENHFSKINCLTRRTVFMNYTSINLLSSKVFELYQLYLK